MSKALCLQLALTPAAWLQLTQSVCALFILLFNVHLLPLFFRLFPIYTGASLDWRLGRGSIYNSRSTHTHTYTHTHTHTHTHIYIYIYIYICMYALVVRKVLSFYQKESKRQKSPRNLRFSAWSLVLTFLGCNMQTACSIRRYHKYSAIALLSRWGLELFKQPFSPMWLEHLSEKLPAATYA